MPYLWTSQITRAQSLSSQPTIAAIGVGGSRGQSSRGGLIARQASEWGQLVAVCDVDRQHMAEFNKSHGNKLATYNDYRELLVKVQPDVVTIGTPDHWHVPISIAALRSGADVYCEKPLTLTIQEGIDICNVVTETRQVFQVGTQQRSEFDNNFLKAAAIVRSGRLGNRVSAWLALGNSIQAESPAITTPPEGLDWNMWLGPAPVVQYSEARRRGFRWWHEYSGGKLTDWGGHHIDIAQWAIGQEHSGPIAVEGKGQYPPIVPNGFEWDSFLDGKTSLPNGFNTAVEFNIDLTYENGSVLSVNHTVNREDGVRFGNGILFEGEHGRIFVNRGKLQGKLLDSLTPKELVAINEQIVELYGGKTPGNHMRNFFECIEDRTQPVSDVFTHHRSMTSCHLCNISMMLGRGVKWNPQDESSKGDKQVASLMTRSRRKI